MFYGVRRDPAYIGALAKIQWNTEENNAKRDGGEGGIRTHSGSR